jgi:hypothetical protein
MNVSRPTLIGGAIGPRASELRVAQCELDDGASEELACTLPTVSPESSEPHGTSTIAR